MAKNGGHPTNTLLTLEEALRRFARQRSESGANIKGEALPDSKVHYADSSTTAKREDDETLVNDREIPRRADCVHSYGELIIHVDLSSGSSQNVRAFVCRNCGDTKLPGSSLSLPEPVLMALFSRIPEGVTLDNGPSTIELAWLNLGEQHRQLVDAVLSTRVKQRWTHHRNPSALSASTA
jgi:hypothetical protein